MPREFHGRQILLVGESAQAAIENASVTIADVGIERDVGERYARRAGFASVNVAPTPQNETQLHEDQGLAVVHASRSVLRQVAEVVRRSKDLG